MQDSAESQTAGQGGCSLGVEDIDAMQSMGDGISEDTAPPIVLRYSLAIKKGMQHIRPFTNDWT